MAVTRFSDGRIELEAGVVAHLRLHRPEAANAISERMWTGLIEACAHIAKRRDIRVLILSGSGRHFCAGADIAEFEHIYASADRTHAYNALLQRAEKALRDLPQPVIARLHGACMGGGLGLALAADLRFADDSVRMAVTASKLGVAYPPEDCARLIAKIGMARAKDLFFSARTINAVEALSWNLIDRLLPTKELSKAATSYATLLAERSPASIGAIKHIVNGLSVPDPDLCERLRPTFSDLFAGDDFREGRAAFLEKRDPRFG